VSKFSQLITVFQSVNVTTVIQQCLKQILYDNVYAMFVVFFSHNVRIYNGYTAGLRQQDAYVHHHCQYSVLTFSLETDVMHSSAAETTL